MINFHPSDLRSENEYVGIERNLSYRDHDPVELVDYSQQQPTSRQPQPIIIQHRPPSQQSTTQSSSVRTQSQQSQASFSRPLSTLTEPTTMRAAPQEPVTSASSLPSHPPSDPEPLTQPVSEQEVQDTKSPLESTTDEVTEQQFLQATGGGRELKLTRRHSVETGKEPKPHQDDDAASARSFSGTQKERVVGQIKSGAYSIAHGKELHGKEWEDAMQRELEEEMARDRERVRMRERRREVEQRERRRERDQKNRDYRARERQEREREREAARERRLARDQDSRYSPLTGTRDDTFVRESPESFL